MKDLRVGCLAIIKGLVKNHHHNGKMVTLVRFVELGEIFATPTKGEMTNISPHNEYGAWVVTGNVFPHHDPSDEGWALIRAKHLIPIDDTDPDAVDEREKDIEGVI